MRLPWTEVNARAGYEVAKLLEPYGMTPARRERYKWACPTASCTSSDGFHTFAQPGRRSRCYVCQTRLTNVDLAALVRGEPPRDACRWLANQLGIYVEPWQAPPLPPVSHRPGAAPPPAHRAVSHLERLLALPNPVLPEVLYADLLDRTTLTPMGAAYLRRRGIPPPFALSIGFRSVDGPGGWSVLRKHLAHTYPVETLRAAGFPPNQAGRVWMPFGGLLPMLLIPFRHGERTVFVRMRTIGPPPGRLKSVIPDWADAGNRYRAPLDVVPPLPFNADALSRPIVHLIEGELNAATLIQPDYGLAAIGLPGAGVLERAWVDALGRALRIVTWYDDDPAGQLARKRVDKTFTLVHGGEWAEARIFHMTLPGGRDPNRLHQDGDLHGIVRASPWLCAPDPHHL
jgi:hypothetical protein